jgi:hypothetical protein
MGREGYERGAAPPVATPRQCGLPPPHSHAPRAAARRGPLFLPKIDQAALTGESLPVKKFTGDTAFSGSTCKAGERHCLVYATGARRTGAAWARGAARRARRSGMRGARRSGRVGTPIRLDAAALACALAWPLACKRGAEDPRAPRIASGAARFCAPTVALPL